jgi:hypothetical protein
MNRSSAAGRITSSLLLALAVGSCRGGDAAPEPGAVLLRFELEPGAAAPDELRLWIYDDSGPLWDGVRIPDEGPLPAPKGRELGTVLVQPGAATGALRIHARALTSGSRLLDGFLTIAAGARSSTSTVELEAALPDDTDGDGIPDAVDDCFAVADSAQRGCASTDGGSDAAPSGCDGGGCGRAAGASCSQDASCASGFCVDGVCCANACVGPCRSCNQPNADGVCQSYAAGSDPEHECDHATCNGAGACGAASSEKKSNGSVCGSGSDCSSGFCTDGVCCNEACGDACRSCATGSCKTLTLTTDDPVCSLPMICDTHGSCVDLTHHHD